MGVIKSHTAEGLLVVDVAGQEKTVPHTNIVADTTLTTSLMPMGLDGTLHGAGAVRFGSVVAQFEVSSERKPTPVP